MALRMTGDRLDEDWQLYRCSDCDPDYADDDDDSGAQHGKPYVLMVPHGEAKPDYCPRCGSYLSLCDGADQLKITNTPAERYAARQAAGA